MPEKAYFGNLGKITVDTLDYAKKTTELFDLKSELSALMCQHVKDCGAIIEQMDRVLNELKELELIRLKQTRLLMEQDIRAEQNV